eukprot:scaffold11454_cov168-Amphora_coffeaeformis.AAC.12
MYYNTLLGKPKFCLLLLVVLKSRSGMPAKKKINEDRGRNEMMGSSSLQIGGSKKQPRMYYSDHSKYSERMTQKVSTYWEPSSSKRACRKRLLEIK